MTREERAFVRLIRKDPADLPTRLVYADWLDDRGDRRGAGHRWLAANAKTPCEYPRLRHDGRPAPWTWWGCPEVRHLARHTIPLWLLESGGD